MFGANIIALKKKNNGVRPIAVGNVLRRLTAKCVSYRATKKLNSYLAPLQLGVGTKGGCEAIIQAERNIASAPGISAEQRCALFVDFQNAFNLVKRDCFLEETRRHIPEASALAESAYGAPSHLFFQGEILASSTGVKQGDPIGPLLFALGQQPLISSIQTTGTLSNSWYLDDGVIFGTPEALHKALDIIETLGPERGLCLSREKSAIWNGTLDPTSPQPNTDLLPDDIPRITNTAASSYLAH